MGRCQCLSAFGLNVVCPDGVPFSVPMVIFIVPATPCHLGRVQFLLPTSISAPLFPRDGAHLRPVDDVRQLGLVRGFRTESLTMGEGEWPSRIENHENRGWTLANRLTARRAKEGGRAGGGACRRYYGHELSTSVGY